jgi:hypothetical protein
MSGAIIDGGSVAALREKAGQLLARRAEIAGEIGENAQQRQTQALKAALGDIQAKRGFDRILGRGAELAAQAAALDDALRAADTEIAVAEAEAARVMAQQMSMELTAHCAARLVLAGDIERRLQDLLPMVMRLGASASEIERRHRELGGVQRILTPLSPDAVAGRLAEFMAGLGYDAWLPLARPESRPALASLQAAEALAQVHYHIGQAQDPQDEVAA